MRARAFKAAGVRLGLRQPNLAKALGMSVPQMNRYERGKMAVPAVVALALEGLERQAAEEPKR